MIARCWHDALLAITIGLGLVAVQPRRSMAQTSNPERSFALAVGGMAFDASGTGTAPVLALRFARALGRSWLRGEVSGEYSAIREQFDGPPTRLGILEIQVQTKRPAGTLQPYVGLGAGTLTYLTEGGGRDALPLLLNGGVGLTVLLSQAVAVQAEGRLRFWELHGGAPNLFVNSAAEVTLAVSHRF